MNRHSKFLFWVTLLSVAAVTTLLAQSPSNSSTEIKTLREQWETNWNAKNLDGLVRLYAQDAVLLTSGGQRIVGRGDIRNFLK